MLNALKVVASVLDRKRVTVQHVMTNGSLLLTEPVHKTAVMDTLLTDELVLACNATKLVHFATEEISLSALPVKTDTSQIIQRNLAVSLVMTNAPLATETPTWNALLVTKVTSCRNILIVSPPVLRDSSITLLHGRAMTVVLDVTCVKRLMFVVNVIPTTS